MTTAANGTVHVQSLIRRTQMWWPREVETEDELSSLSPSKYLSG